MSTSTYYYWLKFMALIHVVLGLGIIVIAQTSFIDDYLSHLSDNFNTAINGQNEVMLRMFLQLFGPTIASWGLLFYLGLQYYYQHAKFGSKLALLSALLLWFTLIAVFRCTLVCLITYTLIALYLF